MQVYQCVGSPLCFMLLEGLGSVMPSANAKGLTAGAVFSILLAFSMLGLGHVN